MSTCWMHVLRRSKWDDQADCCKVHVHVPMCYSSLSTDFVHLCSVIVRLICLRIFHHCSLHSSALVYYWLQLIALLNFYVSTTPKMLLPLLWLRVSGNIWTMMQLRCYLRWQLNWPTIHLHYHYSFHLSRLLETWLNVVLSILMCAPMWVMWWFDSPYCLFTAYHHIGCSSQSVHMLLGY